MGISVLNNAITLIGRLFDTRQPVHPMYPDTAEKPLCVCTPIRQPFPRCTPEEVGIPSETIQRFFAEIAADDSLNMQSIQIYRNGKMISEAFFQDQDPKMWKTTFSACKSVVSLAIGFLYDEGKIHPDDKLSHFLSSRIPQLSRAKDITVHQLLSMSSGSLFNEGAMLVERDWVKGFLSGAFNPGKFAYNSLNTYMLSVLVKEISGESLTDFLRTRLFDPLSIDQVYWEKCPLGIEKGGWGLYIRPEDLAKIGQFVLQDGVWNGRRLLSEDWIHMATTRQIEVGNVSEWFDYGYQIWTGRKHNSFLFNGMLGQNVLCMWDNGIMLVSFAGNDELFQSSNYFQYVEACFGKAFPATLPPNPEAHDQLQKQIASMKDGGTDTSLPQQPSRKTIFHLFRRREPESPNILPKECTMLDGVCFVPDDENSTALGLFPVIPQVIQNNYSTGLESISFSEKASVFYVHYQEKNVLHTFPVGFTHAAPGILQIGSVSYHIRTLGEFTRNEDHRPLLKLRISFAETPFTRCLKLYYTGTCPHIQYSERPGSEFIFSKVIGIKNDLGTTPIIGGTLTKVDNDYLRYRINKKFSPDIRLRKSDSQLTQQEENHHG